MLDSEQQKSDLFCKRRKTSAVVYSKPTLRSRFTLSRAYDSRLARQHYSVSQFTPSVVHVTVTRLAANYGQTFRKVMVGVGNSRAAGIFFRYQTPCMNFF